jgi:nicotinamide phosphoribosyltransferase
MNPLLLTDSYKLTHWKQYPPDTTGIYSYFESRGGAFAQTVFFGLQYILRRHFETLITDEMVDSARQLSRRHFGADHFNEAGWRHVVRDHGGMLPLRIKAVPEGTPVDVRNVLMTVENTCPRCFWVPNYFETVLVHAWYPTTVATQGREIKKVILQYLERTGDPALLPFKLHDFGYRGVSSVESAGIGGAAHLVNFHGTDTLAALDVVANYYGDPCAGVSVPAAEHSTITAWGREQEVEAYRNMLEAYPEGICSVVSDSYDIMVAVRELWGTQLKDRVLQRDGVLVVRPDSGDPRTMCLEVLEGLGEKFGASINGKQYKVLHPKVRVIYGDRMDRRSIPEVLQHLELHRWSADNITFGSGGANLQKLDRDTCQFAFKCSAVRRGGVWHDVYKQPKDMPEKNSKKGRLALVNPQPGVWRTIAEADVAGSGHDDQLRAVYENGHVLTPMQSIETIRRRAHLQASSELME